jgi:hypothetical protein
MNNPWHAVLGRERLWVVFWLYCVLGTICLVLLLATLDVSLGNASMAALIFYLLWAHYSLWTCAFNTDWRLWGYGARVYACVIVAATTASLFVTTRSGSIEVQQVQ